MILVIGAATGLATGTAGAQASRNLLFDDEFDGAAGADPDVSKWSAEVGGGGWGNKELEYYTGSPANAYLDGSGSLVIMAAKVDPAQTLRCWYGPCDYTSARLKTKGKFDLKYGRFEARIRIPRGQGVWPAFWLLGSDIDRVGWPQCGEIDIMENIGREPATVHGTVHGPGYSGAAGIGAPYTLQGSEAFADNFHIFAVEWSANEIRWFVDGKQYKALKPQDLPPGTRWVYDHPFFIILNSAVGGEWPGNPDSSTVFPQRMLVDYVRVYRIEKKSLTSG
jgi:beta-glucanase (GH16 family)